MDFYLKTVYVILGIIVASTLIYIFMTTNILFWQLIDHADSYVYGHMTYILEYDWTYFDNTRAVPGSTVKALIRDEGMHELAIFVQTRHQHGVIVNYGMLLRGISGNLQYARVDNTSVGALREWEEEHVFSSRAIFGLAPAQPLGLINPGTTTAIDNRPEFGRIASLDFIYYNVGAPHIGRDLVGNATLTPTLSFWETHMENSALADGAGASYSTTGRLYTAQTPQSTLPRNHNVTWASASGSPYFINQTSLFHSAFIVDQSGLVIGIYFEEHGVHNNSSLLAQAQINKGMLIGTLPHD